MTDLIDVDLFNDLRSSLTRKDRVRFDQILFQHTVSGFMEHTVTALEQLRQGQQQMAATYQDILELMTSMNVILTEIGNDYDQQAAVIQQQDALIAQLRAQIATGTPITQEQLDELVSTLTVQRDRAKATNDRVTAVVQPPPPSA